MPNGFIIAGTHSGCGKTTITLGLMAALKKRGLKVQPFKAGPDFIDSGLHRIITGRPSRNLDIWMCGEDYVKECFHKYSTDADIAIIEGAMGMYDGEYSTAKLAGLLNLPVILVVDAYGMAESAGAIVRGFVSYSPIHPFTDSPIRIAGVIFNRVASENHFKRLKDNVQDVTVLGYLPRDLNFEIPHRHLGLTVAEENPITDENIEKLAETVLKHVDINKIMESLPPLTPPLTKGGHGGVVASSPPLKVAVAYDKAFCFYYEDNLDLLKDTGAEIVKFSPLSDSAIPDKADAIYIGGGYPELYAEALSKNKSMIEDIYKWAISGKPIYAECGGLMYLSKGIRTKKREIDDNPLSPFSKGEFYKMAGIFPFEMQMRDKLSRLGYREIELEDDCILGKKGDKLRGHEFHYAEIKDGSIVRQCDREEGTVPVTPPNLPLNKGRLGGVSGVVESGLSPAIAGIYSTKNNHGELINASGYKFKNTLASYVHVHFGSNPGAAVNFVDFIKETSWKTSYS